MLKLRCAYLNGDFAMAQRNSIAIADLQVKFPQMQRDRAELADKVREAIAMGADQTTVGLTQIFNPYAIYGRQMPFTSTKPRGAA